MGTIVTVLIVIYCLIVFFIILENEIERLPPIKQKGNDDEDQINKPNDDWMSFSVGFKSSPSLQIYDFPDD